MIRDTLQLRTRYGEVDQMGYVYHANHVIYCHQARTELMRKFGIHDSVLEKNGLLLVVANFQIQYKKPARYDELLSVQTSIDRITAARIHFEFAITNSKNELISSASSMVAFLNSTTERPIRAPSFLLKAFYANIDNQ